MDALRNLRDPHLSIDDKLSAISRMQKMPTDEPFVNWALQSLKSSPLHAGLWNWLAGRLELPESTRSIKQPQLLISMLKASLDNSGDGKSIYAGAIRCSKYFDISLDHLLQMLRIAVDGVEVCKIWCPEIVNRLIAAASGVSANHRKVFECLCRDLGLVEQLKNLEIDGVGRLIGCVFFNAEVSAPFLDILTTLPKITPGLGYQKDLFLNMNNSSVELRELMVKCYLNCRHSSKRLRENTLFVKYVVDSLLVDNDQNLDSAANIIDIANSHSVFKYSVEDSAYMYLDFFKQLICWAIGRSSQKVFAILNLIFTIDGSIIEDQIDSVLDFVLNSKAFDEAAEVLGKVMRYYANTGSFVELLTKMIDKVKSCDMELEKYPILHIRSLHYIEVAISDLTSEQKLQVVAILEVGESVRDAKKAKTEISGSNWAYLTFSKWLSHLTSKFATTDEPNVNLNGLKADVRVWKDMLKVSPYIAYHLRTSSNCQNDLDLFVNSLTAAFFDDQCRPYVTGILKNVHFHESLGKTEFSVILVRNMLKVVFNGAPGILDRDFIADEPIGDYDSSQLVLVVNVLELLTNICGRQLQPLSNSVLRLFLSIKTELYHPLQSKLLGFLLKAIDPAAIPADFAKVALQKLWMIKLAPFDLCGVLLVKLCRKLSTALETYGTTLAEPILIDDRVNWHSVAIVASSAACHTSEELASFCKRKIDECSVRDDILSVYALRILTKFLVDSNENYIQELQNSNGATDKSSWKIRSAIIVQVKNVDCNVVEMILEGSRLGVAVQYLSWMAGTLSSLNLADVKLIEIWRLLESRNVKEQILVLSCFKKALEKHSKFHTSEVINVIVRNHSFLEFGRNPEVIDDFSQILLKTTKLSTALTNADCIWVVNTVAEVALALVDCCRQAVIPNVFDALCETIFIVLRGRWAESLLSLIVVVLENLLKMLQYPGGIFGKIQAESLQRCFNSLVQPRLRMVTKKHAHYLLLSYVKTQLQLKNSLSMKPLTDAIYGLIDVCSEKEKEFIANCLDADGKSMFQALNDRYTADFKFKQK